MAEDKNTFENEEFEAKDIQPIEYKPPFPLEKVVVGVVVGIIAILVVIVLVRTVVSNSKNNSNLKNNAEETTEISSQRIASSIDDISEELINETDSEEVVLKSNNAIICWGDEYMAGSKTNELSIPTYLARKLTEKYSVFNAGCYNDDVLGIAQRQGGVALEVEPVVIPENPMEVPIVIKDIYGDICNIKVSNERNGGLNPCRINGVEGTLSATGQGYAFKRTEKGEAIEIKHPVPVKTKGAIDRKNDIQIFFVGKEQKYDLEKTVDIYKKMVGYLNPVIKSYIIIGPIEGDNASMNDFDKRMKKEFGRNYISIREYISKYAVSEMNISLSSEDMALLEKGAVPKAFMEDEYIFKAETNEYIASIIYERLMELNIL